MESLQLSIFLCIEDSEKISIHQKLQDRCILQQVLQVAIEGEKSVNGRKKLGVDFLNCGGILIWNSRGISF
jgi:hypothetical protein